MAAAPVSLILQHRQPFASSSVVDSPSTVIDLAVDYDEFSEKSPMSFVHDTFDISCIPEFVHDHRYTVPMFLCQYSSQQGRLSSSQETTDDCKWNSFCLRIASGTKFCRNELSIESDINLG